MQIEDWPLGRIRPYPNNPRVLRNAAEKVAESIREFGWRQPIVVDEEGVIIIGHSRLAAAKLLGLETAPVHVAAGMPPEKVRALRIADNKTSEFATWDDQKLAEELAEIMEAVGSVAITGFSQAEFDAIEMQARAEIDRLTAPMAPAAPPLPPEPVDDDLGDEAGDDEGFDEGPDDAPSSASGSDDPPPADMVPFNALMRVEDRQVLYDAINAAKRQHDLTTTDQALLVIARSYLDA